MGVGDHQLLIKIIINRKSREVGGCSKGDSLCSGAMVIFCTFHTVMKFCNGARVNELLCNCMQILSSY